MVVISLVTDGEDGCGLVTDGGDGRGVVTDSGVGCGVVTDDGDGFGALTDDGVGCGFPLSVEEWFDEAWKVLEHTFAGKFTRALSEPRW